MRKPLFPIIPQPVAKCILGISYYIAYTGLLILCLTLKSYKTDGFILSASLTFLVPPMRPGCQFVFWLLVLLRVYLISLSLFTRRVEHGILSMVYQYAHVIASICKKLQIDWTVQEGMVVSGADHD